MLKVFLCITAGITFMLFDLIIILPMLYLPFIYNLFFLLT